MDGLSRLGGAVRRPGFWLLVTVCLVAAGFGGRRLIMGPGVLVESVVRADIVQTVVASGRVVAPRRRLAHARSIRISETLSDAPAASAWSKMLCAAASSG